MSRDESHHHHHLLRRLSLPLSSFFYDLSFSSYPSFLFLSLHLSHHHLPDVFRFQVALQRSLYSHRYCCCCVASRKKYTRFLSLASSLKSTNASHFIPFHSLFLQSRKRVWGLFYGQLSHMTLPFSCLQSLTSLSSSHFFISRFSLP